MTTYYTSVSTSYSTSTYTNYTTQSSNSNIVNSLVTVDANSWEARQFNVSAGAQGISVTGYFTVSGGSDVNVYVMDNTDYVNWANGQSASAYYASGKVTAGTINADLPGSGTYYLVYDNTFSTISQKIVPSNR